MALFAFGLLACSQPQQLVLQGQTMGTTYSVKLPRPPKALDKAGLQSAIDGLLAQINAEMSTYDPESNLSKLNRAAEDQWQMLPPRLMQVLQAADTVHGLTGGVFDPSVGPLVNLWGFGPSTEFKFPSSAQVEAARSRVGYKRLLTLDVRKQRARKQRKDVYIDLSAIAKGFAVDEVAAMLQLQGLHDYMVEIGGEIRVAGANSEGKPWRLAVENPSPAGRSVHGVLAVSSGGIATSGDYRNFFEHEGQRYSHTIDPRTGYPVSHELVSATVIHPLAMQADALATALMVLGPEEGMRLAREQNLAVWFIVRDGEQWKDFYSPAIETYRVNFNP